MIIFGTRGISSTQASGHFHCPQCNEQQPYKRKKVTKFFTLYFIPLIPLGNKGEYVECTTCKTTFYTRILKDTAEKQTTGNNKMASENP